MNGKRAKAIKQEVYGDDYSPKFRKYTGENRRTDLYAYGGPMVNQVGTITADPADRHTRKRRKPGQGGTDES